MKLSIITVNLNNRDGLQKTIDSIVAQTWRDFEWIVIDGGSTDGSKELIEQYAAHFSYWVSEPDKGIYNAMNKGIRVARGEYLNFMNSGDRFYAPTTLEDVFSQPHTADIVYGYGLEDHSDGLKERGRQTEKMDWKTLYRRNIHHQSAFIRRSLFERYGHYEEQLRIVADWVFFVRTILYDKATAEYMDCPVSIFETAGLSSLEGGKGQGEALISVERERMKRQLFPLGIEEDLVKIRSYDEVHESRLAAKLYAVLYRFAVWNNAHWYKPKGK